MPSNETIPRTMKALVKSKAEPGLWLEEVPVPEIGINDVLIRVDRTAICGTDLHIMKWDDLGPAKPFRCPWWWATSSWRSGRRRLERHRFLSWPVGKRRRSRCLWTMPELPGRTPAFVRMSRGMGVHRPGCFAEYIALPMSNVWATRLRSTATWLPSSILLVTRFILRSRFRFWERMC